MHRSVNLTTKNPTGRPVRLLYAMVKRSAEADLGQDALAGEQLCAEADDETEHGETAIPGLSEVDETEAGLSVVGHGWENRLVR